MLTRTNPAGRKVPPPAALHGRVVLPATRLNARLVQFTPGTRTRKSGAPVGCVNSIGAWS
jgi:hypothetical protein